MNINIKLFQRNTKLKFQFCFPTINNLYNILKLIIKLKLRLIYENNNSIQSNF